jgi:hypothetical protein
MKFTVKAGEKFDLKLEIQEKKISFSSVFLAACLVFIISASAYGAATKDYTIFMSLLTRLDTVIEVIGNFLLKK